MAKTVVGSFDSYEEAQRVVNDLSRSGFANSDISIVASNVRGEYKPDTTPTEGESTTGVAVGTGAITGGVVGGVAGLVAGLMGLTIPGVGPIIAAGPLAAALAGAGAGAIAGGLIGGLTHIGVPEEHANYYAESVRRGGALVTVRAEDTDAELAAEIMRRHGAVDIDKRAAQWRESGWSGFDSTAEPYSVEQINRERSAYRSEGAARKTSSLSETEGSIPAAEAHDPGVAAYPPPGFVPEPPRSRKP